MSFSWQAEIARRHGLCVPWTIEIAKHGDIPDTIEYPVFTKSVKSVDGGKKDEGVCWNRSELECKKDEISRFPDGAYGYYGAFMRCKNDETYQKCVKHRGRFFLFDSNTGDGSF